VLGGGSANNIRSTKHPSHSRTTSLPRIAARSVAMAQPDGIEVEEGYFALGERPRSSSRSSSLRSSDSLTMHLTPTTTMASLAAMQYLPVPVLVLSSMKTIMVANEAMGRLLDIDFESTAFHDLSISEVLQDKSMGELGIDILQNGSPILISWEVRNYCTVTIRKSARANTHAEIPRFHSGGLH
jgi:hypothetical protein